MIKLTLQQILKYINTHNCICLQSHY